MLALAAALLAYFLPASRYLFLGEPFAYLLGATRIAGEPDFFLGKGGSCDT